MRLNDELFAMLEFGKVLMKEEDEEKIKQRQASLEAIAKQYAIEEELTLNEVLACLPEELHEFVILPRPNSEHRNKYSIHIDFCFDGLFPFAAQFSRDNIFKYWKLEWYLVAGVIRVDVGKFIPTFNESKVSLIYIHPAKGLPYVLGVAYTVYNKYLSEGYTLIME